MIKLKYDSQNKENNLNVHHATTMYIFVYDQLLIIIY